IRASAAGAIATVFSEYFLRSLGVDPAAGGRTADYVAAAAIVITAGANIRGARLGAAVAGASTVAKFGALAALVLVSFLLGAGASAGNFTAAAGTVDAGLFGLALISVLWAYDGFADVSFA